MGAELVKWMGNLFPYGTLAINVLGSFIIGSASNWMQHATVRFFLMVGFCGGFTTFSTFSLESIHMIREGSWTKAGVYIVSSVVLCLLAAALGTRVRW